MIKIIAEPGHTWSFLAYKFLGSSNRFRELLDANPQYHELDQPKPGDILYIPNNQRDPAINARSLDSVSAGVISIEENIYPWKSLTNYLERIAQYHPFALENIEECNGDTLEDAVEPYIPEENIITDITSNTTVINFNLLG
ncbi:MAG: hypothetical protein R3321_04765 [Nitrososphaeraceae archaeon]|nr:hypothetical protein [Nitrososphaeraceae archaeon]